MSGVRLGLERVREFLQILGEPHLQFAVVHIAGTNGKGSTCAMVARALEDAGYLVGVNHSPHTSDINERIWIDGAPIDDITLGDLLEELDRARQEWATSAGFKDEALTYFEMVTIASFVAFARAGVNIAVIEVGMGGRLDATNVVQPAVVGVTSIGLDHQRELGDTVELIAGEKAGIFKKGCRAVIGPMDESVSDVFVRRAKALRIPLWKPGPDMRRAEGRHGWTLSTPEGSVEVQLQLQGQHQGGNASVALGLLHALRLQGFPVPDEAIVSGLSRAWMPGRLEELRPGLIVDGAHNRAGTEALAKWLSKRERPRLRILLWGMGHEREPLPLVEPLLPYIDELVTTRCAHPKAWDPYDLAVNLQEAQVVLSAGGDIEDTLPDLMFEADEVIVAGSLYLAGAARDLVHTGELDRLMDAIAAGGESDEESAEL